MEPFMKPIEALTVSIGLLAVVDTYITATLIPVPVWVTFIAWASFFILGGGVNGLIKSISSNLTGLLISSTVLVAISFTGTHPVITSILVGIGSAAMVQFSKLKLLNVLPAIVWGFASTVGTTAVTGIPITEVGINNPALIAASALVIGGLFGFVSELLGKALTSNQYQEV